ncbi:MAG: hypothetical protein K2X93_02310 [Candidatus Obscuribacterales bacterium]|nr:hypothetical protein [Candidatus Obscuribacterales bacterium]
MTSSQAAESDKSLFYFPWMASPQFDLLWYFCPIFVAILATVLLDQFKFLAAGLMMIFIVNAFGVGPMHQGPTWFFYFDKKNLEYWSADKKRFFVYYVGPILVGIVSIALAVLAPWLSLVVTTLWGVQHFVQQNFGMTMLYHNKDGNEALPNRKLLLRSLWTPTIFFNAVFYHRLLVPGPVDNWTIGAFAILGLVALGDVLRYALDMKRQVTTNGVRINAPALMFWLISVIYYVPFILPGQKIETVYLIPGTMHWFQYIGLNLILVKHKYDDQERKHDIPCGAYMLMTALCLGSLLIFLATRGFQQDFSVESLPFRVLMGIFVGLSNIHYYQDAFFWRFREKYQRDSIMPYLMSARSH